jgi:hypothetical protein
LGMCANSSRAASNRPSSKHLHRLSRDKDKD